MTRGESAQPYQPDIWNVQLSPVGALYLGRVRVHVILSWLPGSDKANANTTSASASASANMSAHMADTQAHTTCTAGLDCVDRWLLPAVVKWTDGRTEAPHQAISCQPRVWSRLSPKKKLIFIYIIYVRHMNKWGKFLDRSRDKYVWQVSVLTMDHKGSRALLNGTLQKDQFSKNFSLISLSWKQRSDDWKYKEDSTESSCD